MCTVSVEIAMRKTGLIEAMMWTGIPRPMKSPMPQMIAIIATAMFAATSHKPEHQEEDGTHHQAGQWGEERHLAEHLGPERAAGDGVTGQEVALGPARPPSP
jgi:hypothetical protein